MDLRINSTPSSVPIKPATTRAGGASAPDFLNELHRALETVSESQHRATQLQQDVQLDHPGVSLEETMVAIQKAQINFQAALHVRNRMVQAYTDIMNMQV